MNDDLRYRDYVLGRAPALRRTAFLICGDWHRAEDAVQAVLVTLYVRPPRSWDAVDAWVRTSLVRRLVDESRRPWRRERFVEVLPDRPAHQPDPADRLTVVAALRGLPPRQRAVVVLRFWDDLSVAETAHVLSISQGAVTSYTSRALNSLRIVLEETCP